MGLYNNLRFDYIFGIGHNQITFRQSNLQTLPSKNLANSTGFAGCSSNVPK